MFTSDSSLPSRRLLSVARLQESAHWLAVRGRLIEARIVLEHMAKLNGTFGCMRNLGWFDDILRKGTR